MRTILENKDVHFKKDFKSLKGFFFPLLFEDLIKFLIPIINLKKCTLPHLSRIVLMTSNDI